MRKHVIKSAFKLLRMRNTHANRYLKDAATLWSHSSALQLNASLQNALC